MKSKKIDFSVHLSEVSGGVKNPQIEEFASTLEAASELSWGTYTGTITKDVFEEKKPNRIR